jgi:uncharacterized protein (DUF488 family)
LPLFGFSSKNLIKSEENKLFTDYKTNLPQKKKYIDELLQVLNEDKIAAITCFEKDYKCCHRSVLGEFLNINEGVEVWNI